MSKKLLHKIALPTNRVFRIGPLALAFDPGQALIHGGLMFVTSLSADHHNADGELIGHYDFGMKWCQEQGIAIEVIDQNGDLLATSFGGKETCDLKLRRAQYMASKTGVDLIIARHLIAEKLRLQSEVLRELGLASCGLLRELVTMVKDATSLTQVRGLEARGAGLYHGDLEGIQLKWKDRDKKLVSPHWLVVGPRLSPLSDKPRRAVDPTNAIRNLSFSLLAAQCRLAAAVAGLDVHCAFLHSDHETRDSLVYDLMEPYRPVLDRWVLNFVTTNKFTYGDFVQTHEGQCRLHPDLAKYVAANSQIKVDIKPVLQVLMDNLPHTSTKEEPRPVPDVDQVQSPGKTDPLLEMVQKSLQLKGIHKHLRPH